MGRLQKIQAMSSFAETKSNTPSLHIRNIDYHQLEESPYQYRDLTPESVHRLADIILLDGRVLEPLIVRKKAGDTFEILSGHKRYRACKYLVEEEQEESFSMIPCCVMNDMDDVRAEFTVYSTNAYDQKTSYEITQEINGMKKLLDSYPKTFQRPKGKRTVEMIAEELHLSSSTVKIHQAISNRLGESGMEQYKEGSLTKEAAYELSKLPVEKQDSLLEKGVTTAKEIKKIIEEPKQTDINKTTVRHANRKNQIINPHKENLQEEAHVGICPFCGKHLILEYGYNFCGYCGREVFWLIEEEGIRRGFDEFEKDY